MGGCVSSKWVPNVFHVWNVDEYGNLLMPGRMEVNGGELILYQKSREPIRWPMRCLRRYGFDAELFSFESGRRCATGPGIYAFKCRQAETLFTLLQERIQAAGESETSTSTSSTTQTVNININVGGNGTGSILRSSSATLSDTGNYLEPIQRHRTRSSASRDNFAGSRLATQSLPSCHLSNYANEDGEVSPRSPLTPPANVLPQLHEYENTFPLDEESRKYTENRSVYSLIDLPKALKGPTTMNGCRRVVLRGHSLDESGNYARLDDLLKHEHSAKRHLYMNVEPEAVIKQRSVESPSPTSFFPSLPNNNNNNNNNNPISQLVRQVNYAVLDLNYQHHHRRQKQQQQMQLQMQQNQISHEEELSRTLDESLEFNGESYATIDFDKTTALSSTANQLLNDDDSVRKTRHNSKIITE
ncbi:hypothetical protein CHUAL_001050 [Chamberlinius hualienensis]